MAAELKENKAPIGADAVEELQLLLKQLKENYSRARDIYRAKNIPMPRTLLVLDMDGVVVTETDDDERQITLDCDMAHLRAGVQYADLLVTTLMALQEIGGVSTVATHRREYKLQHAGRTLSLPSGRASVARRFEAIFNGSGRAWDAILDRELIEAFWVGYRPEQDGLWRSDEMPVAVDDATFNAFNDPVVDPVVLERWKLFKDKEDKLGRHCDQHNPGTTDRVLPGKNQHLANIFRKLKAKYTKDTFHNFIVDDDATVLFYARMIPGCTVIPVFPRELDSYLKAFLNAMNLWVDGLLNPPDYSAAIANFTAEIQPHYRSLQDMYFAEQPETTPGLLDEMRGYVEELNWRGNFLYVQGHKKAAVTYYEKALQNLALLFAKMERRSEILSTQYKNDPLVLLSKPQAELEIVAEYKEHKKFLEGMQRVIQHQHSAAQNALLEETAPFSAIEEKTPAAPAAILSPKANAATYILYIEVYFKCGKDRLYGAAEMQLKSQIKIWQVCEDRARKEGRLEDANAIKVQQQTIATYLRSAKFSAYNVESLTAAPPPLETSTQFEPGSNDLAFLSATALSATASSSSSTAKRIKQGPPPLSRSSRPARCSLEQNQQTTTTATQRSLFSGSVRRTLLPPPTLMLSEGTPVLLSNFFEIGKRKRDGNGGGSSQSANDATTMSSLV